MSTNHTESASAAFNNYAEAVDWIVNLVPLGIKPGLKRMDMLMDLLGHPERRLKFIHVAGTNGKGSTCAFLTKSLLALGYDVGTFTSPYIEKYTNRMQYNGRDIEEEQLLVLANQLYPLVQQVAQTELGSPTMFEVSTVLAIMYFGTMTYPDYVVWETGLGGRLDSTNIITPIVSVITNVGHDHMDILGDTIGKIAAEKAGIIKSGVPVVCTAESLEAIEVIKEAAANRKATLYLLDGQFKYEKISAEENKQLFHFTGPFREYRNVEITMNGAHQLKNVSAALMTLEVLRQYSALIVEDEDLYEGLRRTQWAGRLELVSQNPRILLDGAHNPEGAEALTSALKETYKYQKLHFMIGMISTKYHLGYLRHILPIVDTLVVTEPDYHKKENAQSLAVKVREVMNEMNLNIDVTIETNWKAGLDKLLSRTEKDDLAVVSGTLYLISDVRSWILHTADCEKGW
jgi:dihydrofolate synthase / folylpolyglutamate synthase